MKPKNWTVIERLSNSDSIHNIDGGKKDRYKANKGFMPTNPNVRYNFFNQWRKRFGHCETIQQVITQARKPIL